MEAVSLSEQSKRHLGVEGDPAIFAGAVDVTWLQTIVGGANEIAVYTAMGMCWSGYLSTHVGMMDALGVRQLASKAIMSHTIGGIAAGVFAHYAFMLIQMFY